MYLRRCCEYLGWSRKDEIAYRIVAGRFKGPYKDIVQQSWQTSNGNSYICIWGAFEVKTEKYEGKL